jgi:hypothetical protein
MENMESVMESFFKEQIVSTELMAHCGKGYSKHLYVKTNVITKAVYFTVVNRLDGTKEVFETLESAIGRYEKIKPVEK